MVRFGSRHVFPLSHLVDLILTSSGISFPMGQYPLSCSLLEVSDTVVALCRGAVCRLFFLISPWLFLPSSISVNVKLRILPWAFSCSYLYLILPFLLSFWCSLWVFEIMCSTEFRLNELRDCLLSPLWDPEQLLTLVGSQYILAEKMRPGVVVCTFNPSIWPLWIRGHPDLHSEFQARTT